MNFAKNFFVHDLLTKLQYKLPFKFGERSRDANADPFSMDYLGRLSVKYELSFGIWTKI